MPDEIKRGRGRPAVGPEIKIALTEDQRRWLKAQSQPEAQTIRLLIDQARKA